MDLNSRWRSAAVYRAAVCGLAKTAASKKSLASKPGGVFRGQKDSDGGDITWLADAAEKLYSHRESVVNKSLDIGLITVRTLGAVTSSSHYSIAGVGSTFHYVRQRARASETQHE